jgi:hypothetical protein
MVESCVPPAVHVSQSRRRLRGRRPRVTRTSSRVQAAARSNTTRVRSILCGRPRSRAVPASIACGSRRILWKRLVVGRAAAAARSAYSGRRPRSDDVFRGPAVGQRIPVDQPVLASHARPRPNPAAHLSVASV